MNNFLKLFLVLMTLSMVSKAHAQTYGIRAGLNLATILAKDDEENYSENFKMKPGFHFGPIAEFPISDMFSFETGLLLSMKGFKSSETQTIFGETVKYEAKMTLFYLDVPLTAKATYDLGKAKVYGTFGPYIGLGLAGKGETKITSMGKAESEMSDIEWGSDEDEDDLKRFDLGLTVGAGVEVKSIQIGISYGLGLANISSYSKEGQKINNRVLGISVGYKFAGK